MTQSTREKIGGYSNMVVGALMGAALLYLAFQLAGLYYGLGLGLLILYEGWTLINKYPEDTLSESVWRLSVRPMVPWLFGVATGWAVQSGFLKDPWLIGAWFFLQGHFFFQAFREGKKLTEGDVVQAVAASPAVDARATEQVTRAAEAGQLPVK